MGALVALLVGVVPSIGPVGSLRSVSAPVGTGALSMGALAAGRGETVVPASTPVGEVSRTLVLYNQTVFPTNATAEDTALGGVLQVAYDPANGTGWATTESVDGTGTLSVFNASDSAGVRQMADGLNAALAYDPETNTMWVTGGGTSANVTVFDASTYGVDAVVGTGGDPEAIVYDNVTNQMFVVNEEEDNLTIIDASTYGVQPLSPYVGEYAKGIAFDWKSRDLFVSHQLCACTGNNVTVLYQSGTAPHASIEFNSAGQSYTIVDDPQNDMVYLTGVSGGIGIIDALTNSSAGNISAPPYLGPSFAYDGITLDPVHHRLYVSLINPDTSGDLISFQPAPTANASLAHSNTSLGYDALPEGIAYDSIDHRILVADSNQYGGASMNLTEVSTATEGVVGSLGLQHLPTGAVYDPMTNAIYVYDGGNGFVYEIADGTDTIVASAFAGYTEFSYAGVVGQVAYDPTDDTIFVDWFTSVVPMNEGVAQFSATSLTFIRNWTEGFDFPSGMAYDPTDNVLYVANWDGENVTAINVTTGAERWSPTGEEPIGVAYDPAGRYIDIANELGNNVTVLVASTGANAANVPAGSEPWGALYDPANGNVYVSDYLGGELTVINGTTNARLTQIAVGGINGPTWLAYDSVNQTIIAAYPGVAPTLADHSGLGLVNASNGTYFGQIEFGLQDYGLAYDTGTQSLFAVATYPGAVYEVGIGGGTPKLRASLVAQPNEITLGAQTYLNTTATGGKSPYRYAYTTLPAGCTNQSVASLPCTPTASGQFFVGVNVTDSKGNTASAVAELTVLPSGPTTLEVSITPVPSTVYVGDSTSLETAVSGGTGPGTYSFVYSTLPGDCTTQNVSTLPCTPTATGTFFVGVNVTDASGNHGSAAAMLTVLSSGPSSLVVSITPVPATFYVGSSTSLETAVSGGTGAGTYTFVYSTLPGGCATQNQSTLPCTPAAVGTYFVGVNVTDAQGEHGSAGAMLTVEAVPNGYRVSVAADPSSFVVGNATELTATVQGSPTGAVTYSWPSLPPGCSSADSSTIACTPTSSGTFLVQVATHDAGGHFENATTNVTVAPHPSAPTSSATPLPWSWIAIAIVVILAALILVFFAARRRKKSPPEATPSTGPGASTGPPEGAGPPPG